MKQPRSPLTQPKKPRHPWLRRILITLGVLICLPPLAVITFLFIKYNSELINTFGQVHFDQPLQIPKLADSTVDTEGTRIFNLTAQTGTTSFFKDKATETWGVNGSYLGPTLRAKRGEKVRINLQNNLPEMTTMHWHGMHLPAQMDGGPHQPVEPGASWSPTWTINQPAATLWYHPHPHGKTAKHVYRGVAGMFILDDDQNTELPSTYGVDDVPLIVQDKRFTSDKQLDFNGPASTGITGNEILVNGVRTPHLNVTTERIRLRILNASNARIYNFGFADSREMQVIGSDGGLLEKPATVTRLMLSPGERAEVVLSFQPGQRAVLRSYPQNLNAGFLNQRAVGGDDSLDIMEFRASDTLAPRPAIPAQIIPPIERLKEVDAKQTRRFKLSGFMINGQKMDINRIDLTVQRGDTEIWEVESNDGTPHNFHVHDVQFQILSLDGKAPPPELQGWKDTLIFLNGQKARLIMKFADYSDPTTPYMFHCHLLFHEDQGMMGQFLILEPGQVPAPKKYDESTHGEH